MKTAQRLGNFLGVGGDRNAAPPEYRAVADGLIITTTHTEAWFVLQSSNTDLMSDAARDTELDAANAAMSRTLAGLDCHLRVLWSPLNAEDYRAEAHGLFTAGDWEAWADLRVQRLEQIGLPTRHLLLGVRISERSGPDKELGRRGVEGLGLASASVSKRELARSDALMRRLGRRLESSPWKAQPASVEMLAWMLLREQRRAQAVPGPGAGAITGAKLANLTRGKVLPYPDHLRVLDGRGDVAAWMSILVMPTFPEKLETPGNGEWLRVLSEINYVPRLTEDDDPDDDTEELLKPVSPEASIRFRVLPKRAALKRVDDARRAAKEQRRSASQGSAEDPGGAVEETEGRMADLTRDMQREDVTLVEDHPRIIVTSTTSLDDLRDRIDAVVTYYGGTGIEVVPAEDEQRELWLETQPGDSMRVTDMGHVRDVTGLTASWFWGGARVGDDSGPIVGYLTGTTPGPFRNDVTSGSERGDATTTAVIGRSGRGKSTAVMMSALDAAFRGGYALVLDFKGDLGGLVTAAKSFGLNSHLIETGRQFAGSADLFRLLDREGSERAQIEVPAQLGIAIPPHLRAAGAETPIQQATNAVIAEGGTPSTWRVIEVLMSMEDELARKTGEALFDLSQTVIGAPFMGKPTGDSIPLAPEPGIWVVQMPGLSLPPTETPREDWNVLQRMSVALMHSMLAFGITTAGRRDLRTLRKLVAIPEVHVLTATTQGSSFLEYIARVGRALQTSLIIDTQDCERLIQLVGIIEQLTTVVGFQLTSREQQDALAELLGLEKNAQTRARIQGVGILPNGDVRHGHSFIRDRRFGVGTVQWDLPSWELTQMLDTSPKKQEDQADDGIHMEKVGAP